MIFQYKTAIRRLIVFSIFTLTGLWLFSRTASTNSPTNLAATAAIPVNPIVVENQKLGTQKWKSPNFDQYLNNMMESERLEHAAQARLSAADQGGGNSAPVVAWVDTQNVKGYASKSSVPVGGQITFQVSSTAAQYQLTIYRMGYYGGNGGVEVVPTVTLPGSNRTNPTPDPTTGMIAANWPVSYTLNVPSNWVSGIYMVWLQNTNSNYVAYIPFVVRNDSQTADILYLVATSTWQAYNGWGGKSLYEYNSPEGRALKVSFDRPYDQNDGSGHYYSGDYNMVQWLEHNGYNVTYATSEDLASNPGLMNNRKLLLSDFHDEYYSMEMFDNVKAFRDAGKSLAYFTSNNIYWQIRYENNSAGSPYRVIVCYKKETDDPSTSRDPWLNDPDPQKRMRTTVLFRDAPVNKPENQILGVMFESLVAYGDYYSWTVQNADHWIYQGTGLSNGNTIAKLVGYEWDRIYNNGYSPANMTIIGQTAINNSEGSFLHQAVIWQAPSGAWVLNVSINYWQYFLEGNYIWPLDTRVQRMTINVLNRMISDGGGVINNTPTPSPTITRTPTAGPSATPSRTFTPSVTFTASSTATPSLTNTPSKTLTATATLTSTDTPGPTSNVFYRAINMGGPALVIDGNNWEDNSGTTPNFTVLGSVLCNPWQPVTPATDANRTSMIQCSRQHWAQNAVMSSVPNGTYQVYVYTWLDWADPNPPSYTFYLQGQQITTYQSGPVGKWNRLGPWTANVTAGTLTLQTNGGIADISGIEVYRVVASTTATPTATNTATNTATSTVTTTNTATSTATSTTTATKTSTLTATATFTATATDTPTNTVTATVTATNTATATATFTATVTHTATSTTTATFTPSVTQTHTPSATSTPLATLTHTPTHTATATDTATVTATYTKTATATHTATETFTPSATATGTPLPTNTPSATFTASATDTATLTATATHTETATETFTPSATATGTSLPTNTPSATFTASATDTATLTATATHTETATETFTPSATTTGTSLPTNTPSATFTASATDTATLTATATHTETATETFTPSVTSTGTPLPTNTPSATFTASATDTATLTATATHTETATETFTPSATATGTPLPTNTPSATFTASATDTATLTATYTETPTEMVTATDTVPALVTATPLPSNTPSATVTNTEPPLVTATPLPSNTPDNTATATGTNTATNTPSATVTATATATATNTSVLTDTATVTQTATVTATLTVTGTSTSTNTSVPTNTATATVTATFTPSRTLTPTITATTGSSLTFYRAINVGGPALVIDGNNWEANSGTTTNFTTNGTAMCDPWVTLNPATDAARAQMISCYREHWAFSMAMSNVPAGTYVVYLYVWQEWNNTSQQAYNIGLEGQTVASNYNPGTVGGKWERLGPWTINLTDGTINIATSGGGLADISGLEVYRLTSGGGASATPLPSATPTITATATITRTNTPAGGATSTPTNTVTPSRTFTPSATSSRTNTPLPTSTITSTSAQSNTPTLTSTPTATGAGATATFTPSFTRTPTALASMTFTPSRTFTPTPTTVGSTATPTRTSTSTRTPTITPTPSNTPSGSPTFYKAYNLGGASLVIDGRTWLAGTSSDLAIGGGTTLCNQAVTLTPATDANRATMIRCSVTGTAPDISVVNIANGMYDVYVYIWEDDTPSTFSMSVQAGQVFIPTVNSGAAGSWQRLGPYTVSITGGWFSIDSFGGQANFSGLEFYSR